jgi:hypothetical protein
MTATPTRVDGQDIRDLSITDADVAAANKDGTAATPSLRTLGTGAQQAAPGNINIRDVFMTFGQAMMVSVTNQGAILNGTGQYAYNHYGGGANGVLTDADGVWLYYGTTGSASDRAGFDIVNDSGSPVHQRRFNFKMLIKFRLGGDVSGLRCFAGASGRTDQMGWVNQVGDDNPTGTASNPYIGLSYSNGGGGRNDTNFQIQRFDGSTRTTVDTGIPADTAAHYVLIESNESTPSFTVTLFDHTGASIYTATFTTAIPGSTDLLSPCVAVWNMSGGGNKYIYFSYARGANQI